MCLYEDKHLIIVLKKPGELSEHSNTAPSLPERIQNELSLPEIPHPVHRLDREVGGIMLLAKSPEAMAACSRLVNNNLLKKEYLAITEGTLSCSRGEMKDLLFKQSSINKTFIVDRMRKGVKEAILSYQVLAKASLDTGCLSLVSVVPHTGRTHQIRVQFASRGVPLVGDRKYGAKIRSPIGLMCYSLSFPHPYLNKQIYLTAPRPKDIPFSISFTFEESFADTESITQYADFIGTTN